MKNKRKQRVLLLQKFRKIHRTTGVILFVFILLIGTTGLLLGWKKHSNGIILPKSYKGTSTNLKEWLPIDSLHTIACNTLHSQVSPDLKLDLERIDVRKDKGMVKFVFLDHYWGIQLDGATGNLLHIERRRSDIVENIHDGSILDYVFNTKGEILKLIYTSIMGLSLILFSLTGFWLWYDPKWLKKNRLF